LAPAVPIAELAVDNSEEPLVPWAEDVTVATFDHSFLHHSTPLKNDYTTSSILGDLTKPSQHHDASSCYDCDAPQVIYDPYGEEGQYTGTLLRSTNMPHGVGRMVYSHDGRTYDGEWRQGRWHGTGTATFPNGDRYQGEYRTDQRHGRGKYSWSSGRIYEGEFWNDQRHGKGKFYFPDGSSFSGDFHHGIREGQGLHIFADGGYYDGSWVNGRFEGFGGMFHYEGGFCILFSIHVLCEA